MCWTDMTILWLTGIVHPKMNILLIIYPQAIQDVYNFLSSAKEVLEENIPGFFSI